MGRQRGPRLVRSAVVTAALITVAGACDSAGRSTAARGPETTPTGTAPLVAPARSVNPTFSGEAAAVERAFRDRLDALEHGDLDAVMDRSATSDPSLRAELATFMGTYRVRLFRINAITVRGNRATVDYEDSIVGRTLNPPVSTLLAQHEAWRRDGGHWRSVTDRSSTPGIPRDLKTLTVRLPDHDRIEIPTPLPDAGAAFLLKNTGAVTKGVFILGIPADADVDSLLPAVARVGVDRDRNIPAAMPSGVVEMGATPDVRAHGTGTMVFSNRLPTGRYLLVSRSSSHADTTATLLPGEYAEFTVR